MSYLQDSQKRNKKIRLVFVLLSMGIVFYVFSSFILSKSFNLLSVVVVPMWEMQKSAREGVGGVFSMFQSKQQLEYENQRLMEELSSAKLMLESLSLVEQENDELMIQMGREVAVTLSSTIAAVLSGPNIPPYEGLVIDAGIKQGVSVGDRVIYQPNIVIGEISQAFGNYSKVKLYSADGTRTNVLIPTEEAMHTVAIGFGGGNFFMELPNSIKIQKGMQLLIPGSDIYILGVVEHIQFDPVTSTQKILVKYPVNIKNMRFVHVVRISDNEYLE